MDKVESEGRNDGVIVDILFLGPTRPTMVWGVTYVAFIVNMIITVEAFVFTRDLLWLGVFFPIHAIFALICWTDPRAFDLIRLWGMTKGWQVILSFVGLGNYKFWKSASYSPVGFRRKASGLVLRKYKKKLSELL